MSEARDRDSSSATYTPPQGKYTNVLIPVLINLSKFYTCTVALLIFVSIILSIMGNF